jgi:hypothetical protein
MAGDGILINLLKATSRSGFLSEAYLAIPNPVKRPGIRPT